MSLPGDTLDSHLAHLGGTRKTGHPKHPPPPPSNRHNSFTSTGTHRSIQNVTDSLKVNKINEEITDTENSIRALEQEIQLVERRRSRATSIYGEGQQGTNYATDKDEDDEGDDYFLRHSRPRTYKPVFTLTFLAVCLIMFMVEIALNSWSIEELRFNPLIGPSVEVLLQLGAKETELLQQGEAWRLFTPMVLHVGIVHLLSNMLGLVAIGVPMEQEFGTWRIALIAFVSGLFGVVFSALMAPNIVGVGASGAIFGLFGAAWADLIQNWQVYRGKQTNMLAWLLGCTLANFFFGLLPFVDNYAHLGGFIVGLVTGTVVLVKRYGDVKRRRSIQIFLRAFSVLILPILLGVMIFLLFVGFDLAESCSWCSYLSCVPFPPGANDKWWDCTPCLNGFGEFKNFTQGGTVVIICPDEDLSDDIDPEEQIFNVPGDLTLEEFEQTFSGFCYEVCD